MNTIQTNVRTFLLYGPATRSQIAAGLNIPRKQAVSATCALLYRGEIAAEQGPPTGTSVAPERIYSICDEYAPKPTLQSIVSYALASQPELARVWM